jgi:hypothetical protein
MISRYISTHLSENGLWVLLMLLSLSINFLNSLEFVFVFIVDMYSLDYIDFSI